MWMLVWPVRGLFKSYLLAWKSYSRQDRAVISCPHLEYFWRRKPWGILNHEHFRRLVKRSKTTDTLIWVLSSIQWHPTPGWHHFKGWHQNDCHFGVTLLKRQGLVTFSTAEATWWVKLSHWDYLPGGSALDVTCTSVVTSHPVRLLGDNLD